MSMYEPYTRQALPAKQYRELLGSAICVFNSNNSFVIENFLYSDVAPNNSWYDLIDMTSGQLLRSVRDTISTEGGSDIADLFDDLIDRRNRIVHSFQITKDGEQMLATKDKAHVQYIISKDYLLKFIADNEKLALRLYEYRDAIKILQSTK